MNMHKKPKVPSNAQLEQLVPSTAAEFYTSSRMGWVELDDKYIDSSITAGLLMNQLIEFERQQSAGVYHWKIYVGEIRSEFHIGTLSYRQVDSNSVALAYGIVPIHYENEELMLVLRDAAITAKLKVVSKELAPVTTSLVSSVIGGFSRGGRGYGGYG